MWFQTDPVSGLYLPVRAAMPSSWGTVRMYLRRIEVTDTPLGKTDLAR